MYSTEAQKQLFPIHFSSLSDESDSDSKTKKNTKGEKR